MALYDISGSIVKKISSVFPQFVDFIEPCKVQPDFIERGKYFTDDYLLAIKRDSKFRPFKYYDFKFLDVQISLVFCTTPHNRFRRFRISTFNFQPKCCHSQVFDYYKRCYYGAFDTLDEALELFVCCIKEFVDSFICDNGIMEIFN